MVPHPQSRPRQVSQRPPTRSATTLTGGLILHAKVELISSQSQAIRLHLPELGSIVPRLSRSAARKPQIVTTNFDRLFEKAQKRIPTHVPPGLPDLASGEPLEGLV